MTDFRTKGFNYVDAMLGEVEVLLEVEYDRGDPGVHTFSNGDPGYPGTDSSTTLIDVYIGGESVLPGGECSIEDVFCYSLIEKWEAEALEKIEADLSNEREAAMCEASDRAYDAAREDRVFGRGR